METLENILITLNPIDNQRMFSYTLFLVNGEVPLTSSDLQGLWSEWQQSPTRIRIDRYANASFTRNYEPRWQGEREKFFNLFKQFALLENEGKDSTICLIYPDGREVFWNPATSTEGQSYRGAKLKEAMSLLNPKSMFGVAVTVQYAYRDDQRLYQTVETRATSPALTTAITRSILDKGYAPTPTLTDKPLPLAVIHDFWLHFRNTNPRLIAKYGTGTEQPSPLFQEYQGLYEKGGFKPFFQRFADLDAKVSKNKLVMASFLHDGGFQYVIYRLAGEALRRSGSKEVFVVDKLVATPGTKLLASKAPKDVRMVIKALYVEK